MPEGHSVHRIARQFARNYVGREVAASSPQGRFAEGAALLDGRTVREAQAVGKQMFLEFSGDAWLRVHLGLYGAWDFSGEIVVDPTIAASNGRMGQTNQRGTVLAPKEPGPDGAGAGEAILDEAILDEAILDEAGENSLTSIGAPRRTRQVKPRRRGRFRMSEQTSELKDELADWPPPIVGQVRLRLLTEVTCADLRGPTACTVMTPDQVEAFLTKLGPDPLVGDPAEGEERFVAAVRRTRTAIGLLLMDPQIVSGIGNVYRAELLFRARLNPHTPGRDVPEELLREIWRDWTRLLAIGVETGQMMTMDDLDPAAYRRAMAKRDDRHWVYHRAGLPCRVCGTEVVVEEAAGRKLYWCPSCQA